MKAITILQPWASLVACGEKKIETRSWATRYRGEIAIHAAAKHTRLQFKDPYHDILSKYYKLHVSYKEDEIPYGSLIAIADLVDCAPFTSGVISGQDTILLNGEEVPENEKLFGNCILGNWGWLLENIRQVNPFPIKGQQRIWNCNVSFIDIP